MAWNLHTAKLPDDAKAFLSVLGSCGDARKAAEEVGATEADLRNWARDSEFLDHRRQALKHYESWKTWTPPRGADPAQWPPRGRLDQRFDPCRIAHSVEQLLGGPS